MVPSTKTAARGSAPIWGVAILVNTARGTSGLLTQLTVASEASVPKPPPPCVACVFRPKIPARHDGSRSWTCLQGAGPKHAVDAGITITFVNFGVALDEAAKDQARLKLAFVDPTMPAAPSWQMTSGAVCWARVEKS